MRELGLDDVDLDAWFEVVEPPTDTPVLLVRVSSEVAATWVVDLVPGARRCYISDAALDARAAASGADRSEVLAAALPDRGSVMAGDFGEILTFVYLGRARAGDTLGPKKWRLKDDRRRPAPHSDVVQFVVPGWPQASAADELLCAEVKTKSTDGNSTPISSAIADSEKDRLTRLARTLAWLKERALLGHLESPPVAVIDRFLTDAHEHAPVTKTYFAVAVVSESVLDGVLAEAPETPPQDCTVLVLVVPELKAIYEAVFDAVAASAG